MVSFFIDVAVSNTEKLIYAVLSQPFEAPPTNFLLYVPVVVNDKPFQTYGKVFLQTGVVTVDIAVSNTEKLMYAVLSQPFEAPPTNFLL